MNIALILSGGIGSRLVSDVPKQYVRVCGKMVVTYALECFRKHDRIDSVQVVADRAWQDAIRSELFCTDGLDSGKLNGFSTPGKSRQLSILNGLKDIRQYAGEDDAVIIHDAARPLVTADLITALLDGLDGYDGAVPVLHMKDTVYMSADGNFLTGILERSRLLAGQAPEAFLFGKYLRAIEALSEEELLRLSGSAEPALMADMRVRAIPGNERNFKITTNEDLDRFIRIVESNGS